MARKTLPPARELLRDRVLLAVYGLADAEGLACYVGRAAIARHVGVPVETANRFLELLALEGVLAARAGGCGRATHFVILDHPRSRELLDHLDRVVWVDFPKGWPPERYR